MSEINQKTKQQLWNITEEINIGINQGNENQVINSIKQLGTFISNNSEIFEESHLPQKLLDFYQNSSSNTIKSECLSIISKFTTDPKYLSLFKWTNIVDIFISNIEKNIDRATSTTIIKNLIKSTHFINSNIELIPTIIRLVETEKNSEYKAELIHFISNALRNFPKLLKKDLILTPILNYINFSNPLVMTEVLVLYSVVIKIQFKYIIPMLSKIMPLYEDNSILLKGKAAVLKILRTVIDEADEQFNEKYVQIIIKSIEFPINQNNEQEGFYKQIEKFFRVLFKDLPEKFVQAHFSAISDLYKICAIKKNQGLNAEKISLLINILKLISGKAYSASLFDPSSFNFITKNTPSPYCKSLFDLIEKLSIFMPSLFGFEVFTNIINQVRENFKEKKVKRIFEILIKERTSITFTYKHFSMILNKIDTEDDSSEYFYKQLENCYKNRKSQLSQTVQNEVIIDKLNYEIINLNIGAIYPSTREALINILNWRLKEDKNEILKDDYLPRFCDSLRLEYLRPESSIEKLNEILFAFISNKSDLFTITESLGIIFKQIFTAEQDIVVRYRSIVDELLKKKPLYIINHSNLAEHKNTKYIDLIYNFLEEASITSNTYYVMGILYNLIFLKKEDKKLTQLIFELNFCFVIWKIFQKSMKYHQPRGKVKELYLEAGINFDKDFLDLLTSYKVGKKEHSFFYDNRESFKEIQKSRKLRDKKPVKDETLEIEIVSGHFLEKLFTLKSSYITSELTDNIIEELIDKDYIYIKILYWFIQLIKEKNSEVVNYTLISSVLPKVENVNIYPNMLEMLASIFAQNPNFHKKEYFQNLVGALVANNQKLGKNAQNLLNSIEIIFSHEDLENLYSDDDLFKLFDVCFSSDKFRFYKQYGLTNVLLKFINRNINTNLLYIHISKNIHLINEEICFDVFTILYNIFNQTSFKNTLADAETSNAIDLMLSEICSIFQHLTYSEDNEEPFKILITHLNQLLKLKFEVAGPTINVYIEVLPKVKIIDNKLIVYQILSLFSTLNPKGFVDNKELKMNLINDFEITYKDIVNKNRISADFFQINKNVGSKYPKYVANEYQDELIGLLKFYKIIEEDPLIEFFKFVLTRKKIPKNLTFVSKNFLKLWVQSWSNYEEFQKSFCDIFLLLFANYKKHFNPEALEFVVNLIPEFKVKQNQQASIQFLGYILKEDHEILIQKDLLRPTIGLLELRYPYTSNEVKIFKEILNKFISLRILDFYETAALNRLFLELTLHKSPTGNISLSKDLKIVYFWLIKKILITRTDFLNFIVKTIDINSPGEDIGTYTKLGLDNKDQSEQSIEIWNRSITVKKNYCHVLLSTIYYQSTNQNRYYNTKELIMDSQSLDFCFELLKIAIDKMISEELDLSSNSIIIQLYDTYRNLILDTDNYEEKKKYVANILKIFNRFINYEHNIDFFFEHKVILDIINDLEGKNNKLFNGNLRLIKILIESHKDDATILVNKDLEINGIKSLLDILPRVMEEKHSILLDLIEYTYINGIEIYEDKQENCRYLETLVSYVKDFWSEEKGPSSLARRMIDDCIKNDDYGATLIENSELITFIRNLDYNSFNGDLKNYMHYLCLTIVSFQLKSLPKSRNFFLAHSIAFLTELESDVASKVVIGDNPERLFKFHLLFEIVRITVKGFQNFLTKKLVNLIVSTLHEVYYDYPTRVINEIRGQNLIKVLCIFEENHTQITNQLDYLIKSLLNSLDSLDKNSSIRFYILDFLNWKKHPKKPIRKIIEKNWDVAFLEKFFDFLKDTDFKVSEQIIALVTISKEGDTYYNVDEDFFKKYLPALLNKEFEGKKFLVYIISALNSENPNLISTVNFLIDEFWVLNKREELKIESPTEYYQEILNEILDLIFNGYEPDLGIYLKLLYQLINNGEYNFQTEFRTGLLNRSNLNELTILINFILKFTQEHLFYAANLFSIFSRNIRGFLNEGEFITIYSNVPFKKENLIPALISELNRDAVNDILVTVLGKILKGDDSEIFIDLIIKTIDLHKRHKWFKNYSPDLVSKLINVIPTKSKKIEKHNYIIPLIELLDKNFLSEILPNAYYYLESEKVQNKFNKAIEKFKKNRTP